LHSRVLVVLAFWSLAIFGGFAGFYRGLPVPAWLVSTGVAATAILLVTMGATVANLWLTLSDSGNAKAPLLGFFKTSLAFYAAVAVGAAFAALVPQLRLTLFGEGLEQLALYGFVAFALFGALHYLVPLLSGATSARFIGVTCWATLIGILVFAGAYLAGGIVQQRNLEDGGKSFLVVMNAMKPFIRISTLGVLVLVIGNTAMLLRVLGLVRECCRNCCAGCDEPAAGAAKLQPARAAR
jgi:cbb3-type cytochrome oxidase subunit 1